VRKSPEEKDYLLKAKTRLGRHGRHQPALIEAQQQRAYCNGVGNTGGGGGQRRVDSCAKAPKEKTIS